MIHLELAPVVGAVVSIVPLFSDLVSLPKRCFLSIL